MGAAIQQLSLKKYKSVALTTYITSYCSISDNAMTLNGETVLTADTSLFADFSKKAYQHLELQYPKFFKMDALSKLAFLASELLLTTLPGNTYEGSTALLFANRSSSLDTDMKYQQSIADKNEYYPSPAVFVYTLPNIGMGEISIRNGLKSENSFFIFEAFNSEFMTHYANVLIETGKATAVLCGWVELYQEEYRAFMYLVSKEGIRIHNQENLENLYNR